MKRFLLLLTVLGLLCPVVATSAAPSKPVTAGLVRRVLPNGLRVLVLPRHTAPVVTTMMWYRVGSRDELAGATGLAHFLEHLLFKGTKKLAKGAVDRLTYQNGGTNNAFTFNDYTGYEFNFPKSTWKVALQIEADRIRNTVFDKKEFEAERQVVMEERRISEDNPESRFFEQLNALTYLVHPYRNPVVGWMDDLKRVTRDEVFAFYQKYYVPANATLVITGDVTPEEALAAASSAFAAVPKLPAPRRSVVTEPPQLGGRRLRLTLPTQVPRVALSFHGPRRGAPDFYPLEVLTYALTEGKLSRLYQRLVEQDQIAAAVDGSLGSYRDAGEITFYANAREGASLEQLETAIWEELERAAREPLTDRELERAKNQFQADWVNGVLTANDLATVVGEADALGGVAYLETLQSRIQAVTAAQVQKAAQQYLRREKANTGHLLPEAAPKQASAVSSAAAPRPRAGRGLAARASQKPVTAISPAPAVAFARLKPLEKVLPNGMRLILLEKHDVPSVTLSARVDAGSLQETETQAGLANLVARMLEEGTRSRGHREISAQLEQVGAAFEAGAERESTSATLQVLSRYTGDLVPLFADLIRSPSFPSDRLEQERDRLLVALKEEADDAGTVARNAFRRLVYGSHPAGHPVSGTEVTVKGFSREDLEQFHARYYRPDSTTLVAVGDFNAADLVRRLDAAFGDWAAQGPKPAATLPAVQRQSEKRSERVTMDKAQVQILLGHLGVRRADPDYIALKVMDNILGEGVGGGFTARIPYQLRDVQGLAYGVGSSITSSAAREPGLFVASLGTEPSKEQAAVTALLKEIRRIRSAPVTESELKEAINYLASSYVFSFQTNSQLAAYLQMVQKYGLGYNYRQRFVQEVRKVTRADVQRVARKYLDPDRYTLVVVGPATAGPPPKERR